MTHQGARFGAAGVAKNERTEIRIPFPTEANEMTNAIRCTNGRSSARTCTRVPLSVASHVSVTKGRMELR